MLPNLRRCLEQPSTKQNEQIALNQMQQQLIEEKIEDDPQVYNVEEIIQNTLSKLNTIEKIEILMVLLNYFTKGFFMYLVYVNFTTVFLPNTLLLFSYLLYAFLEFAAFGASIALIFASRIIRIILRVNLYPIDSFVCLPILYTVFKFCLIVTFFVQSVVLMLFSKFNDWKYPILLGASLFVILMLQFSRLILMFGGRYGIFGRLFDLETLFNKLAPSKVAKTYQFVRYAVVTIYDNYVKMNPQFKEYIIQVHSYKNQAQKLQKDYGWVADKYIHAQELETISQQNPQPTSVINQESVDFDKKEKVS